MKPSSDRSTVKPKKGDSRTASAAILAEGTVASAHRKAQGVPVNKALERKVLPDPTHGRPFHGADSISVAFAGSGVMAHDAVMKGVPGRALTRIWDATMGTLPTDALLRAIGVSARTAHRIKSDPDKPLDARTTDGIYRLESVRAMAAEVLGSVEAADEWLNTEAMGVEFRRPIDLLSTSPGADAVKTLLQRMKYGVYA